MCRVVTKETLRRNINKQIEFCIAYSMGHSTGHFDKKKLVVQHNF